MIPLLAILIAQGGPTLNNPAPQTGSKGTPITVNDCSFLYRTSDFITKVVKLKIEFTNESAKIADLVTFSVTSDIGDATIRDVGSYDPGVELKHEYRQYYGRRMYSTDENLHCSVQAVHFTDGTVWQNGVPAAATQDVDPNLGLALENQASGVFVQFVAPGGPGDAAGVRQNDHIVSIGSNAVSSIEDVKTILGMTPAGTAVLLVINRNGALINVKIKTGGSATLPP